MCIRDRHYFITYEGKDGQWYELPINTIAVDIAYYVAPGSSRQFVARLYPEVNGNTSGRYRFFYEVSLESRENIRMMAEFRLTNNYEKAKQAEKLRYQNDSKELCGSSKGR